MMHSRLSARVPRLLFESIQAWKGPFWDQANYAWAWMGVMPGLTVSLWYLFLYLWCLKGWNVMWTCPWRKSKYRKIHVDVTYTLWDVTPDSSRS